MHSKKKPAQFFLKKKRWFFEASLPWRPKMAQYRPEHGPRRAKINFQRETLSIGT